MKNSSFWISLFVFVLLMCSCKTKKLDSNVRIRNDIQSDLSYLNKICKIGTSNTAYFANEAQNIVIEEDITETEYDKESGKPIKETKTKRKATQDTNQIESKEVQKGVESHSQGNLNHSADVSNKLNSEAKEVTESDSKSFWSQFGESLGIILGWALIIGLFGRFLQNKFRVN